MEIQMNYTFFERRPIMRSKAPAVKWVKEWVPQDVVSTGGKCLVLKWVTEAMVKALKERLKEPEAREPEPEPTTEVLFLCSYEGCGKTFIDAGALRKHSHIHGERQYVCHYENCGKKFLDSSKLKRHYLIHTGARDFVCTYEGCGKAFSLDFNLRSHMKTHSQENYHICPHPGCGKRYAHEYKLKNHILAHHEKNNNMVDMTKYSTQQIEKPPSKAPAEKPPPKTPTEKAVHNKALKSSGGAYGSGSSDRPYACPYEGCDKAYIHEYKLNLHLRREHPSHFTGENNANKNTQADNNDEMDEGSDQDAGKRRNIKAQQQTRPKPNLKGPPAKVAKRKGLISSPVKVSTLIKKPWPIKGDVYEEDSEETEEDRDDNVEDGWRYGRNDDDDGDDDDDDDEETEYED